MTTDLLAERLRNQVLAGPPARDAVAVAERLLAIQGQDPRGARLAVRARTQGLSTADVDRALTEERSLVITWLNRGTLHLVRAEDYHWLHALTTPQLRTANARRLAQECVSPEAADRGVSVVARSLAEEGPLTRAQLRDRIAATGVRAEGQAVVHVLMLASLRGLVVRGPMIGRDHAYALVRDWLGEPRPVDRDAALAELARRYLAGHAPADDRELARWAGLPLRDARPERDRLLARPARGRPRRTIDSPRNRGAPATAPARSLRASPPGLEVPCAASGPPRAASDRRRPVSSVRGGPRTRGGHLEPSAWRGRPRGVPPPSAQGRRVAGGRRCRRRAVPDSAGGAQTGQVNRENCRERAGELGARRQIRDRRAS